MTKILEKEKIEKIITDVISGLSEAYLATIDGNRPWVRYVMTYNVEGTLKLQCSTSTRSRKVEQIKKNPNIHLTMGKTKENPIPYVQYVAKAIIKTDTETKKAHWHEGLKQFFSSPEDPHYCVLEFEPEIIEVWGASGDMTKPLVWKK